MLHVLYMNKLLNIFIVVEHIKLCTRFFFGNTHFKIIQIDSLKLQELQKKEGKIDKDIFFRYYILALFWFGKVM